MTKELKTAHHYNNEHFVAPQQVVEPPLQPSVYVDATQFEAVSVPLPSATGAVDVLPAPVLSPWLTALVGLTLTYGAVEWGLWWWQSIQQHWLLGTLVSAISVTALGWGGQLLYRLRRNRQQLVVVNQQRERWLSCQLRSDSETLITQLCRELPVRATAPAPAHLNGSEHLQWFHQTHLVAIEQKIDALATEAACQTGIAVALSPFALADMLIVAWRSQRLIGQIAQAYGASPDAWLRLSLLRRFITTVATAGSAEMLSDLTTDFFSAELAGKLSARVGQGVLTASLMLKLADACKREFSPAPVARLPANAVRQLTNDLLRRLSVSAK